MHTKMAERQRDDGADPTTWDGFAMQKEMTAPTPRHETNSPCTPRWRNVKRTCLDFRTPGSQMNGRFQKDPVTNKFGKLFFVQNKTLFFWNLFELDTSIGRVSISAHMVHRKAVLSPKSHKQKFEKLNFMLSRIRLCFCWKMFTFDTSIGRVSIFAHMVHRRYVLC
jgi:hypothetical protein